MSDIKKKQTSEGDFVFFEGDPAFEAFIINSGRVEIFKGTRGNKRVVEVMSDGQLFGEMGIISDSPRSVSARCLTACNLTVIDRELLLRKVRQSDPFIRFLVEFLIERIKKLS